MSCVSSSFVERINDEFSPVLAAFPPNANARLTMWWCQRAKQARLLRPLNCSSSQKCSCLKCYQVNDNFTHTQGSNFQALTSSSIVSLKPLTLMLSYIWGMHVRAFLCHGPVPPAAASDLECHRPAYFSMLVACWVGGMGRELKLTSC